MSNRKNDYQKMIQKTLFTFNAELYNIENNYIGIVFKGFIKFEEIKEWASELVNITLGLYIGLYHFNDYQVRFAKKVDENLSAAYEQALKNQKIHYIVFNSEIKK